jgi:hypothetical protein
MCSLMVRTHIVNRDAPGCPRRVSEEATEEGLYASTSVATLGVMGSYCIGQNIVARVRRYHERSILHHAGVVKGPYMSQLLKLLRHDRGTQLHMASCTEGHDLDESTEPAVASGKCR